MVNLHFGSLVQMASFTVDTVQHAGGHPRQRPPLLGHCGGARTWRGPLVAATGLAPLACSLGAGPGPMRREPVQRAETDQPSCFALFTCNASLICASTAQDVSNKRRVHHSHRRRIACGNGPGQKLARVVPKPDPASPMSPARDPKRCEAPCLRSPAMLCMPLEQGLHVGQRALEGGAQVCQDIELVTA